MFTARYALNVHVSQWLMLRVSTVHTHVRTNVFRTELLQKAHSEQTQSRNLLAMLPRLGETFQSSSCTIQVGFMVRLAHRGLTFHGSFTFSSFHYDIISAATQSHRYLNNNNNNNNNNTHAKYSNRDVWEWVIAWFSVRHALGGKETAQSTKQQRNQMSALGRN